jgi:hemolysin III
MLLKVVWFDRATVIGGILYIGLGWMVVVAAPVLISHLGLAELLLLAAGGLLYTGGTVVLRTRRPNPFPLVFGYHEVWHTFVIVAAALHFAAILLVVRGA